MSVETSATLFSPAGGVIFLAKAAVIILSGLYFAFSLIVLRQVNLMTDTLITESSFFLKFFAIMHSGFALGIIVLLIGYLFG
jgi:hypothetical protein